MNETNSEEEIFIQFVAPKLFLFEEHRFALLQNSETKELEPDFYYRPDYLSYEEYGTTNWWPMLLFINDIPTIEDFNVPNVKIPNKDMISRLIDSAASRKTLQEIVPLYEIPPRPTSPLFATKKLVPREISNEPVTPPFTPTDVYFKREIHTVDIIMARRRYVDLEEEPVVESVVLRADGQPNFLKSKHYDIVKGSIGNNRLIWDPRRLSGGVGLVDVLVEGTKFEVEYARQVTI
jgi:hypothetical protein